MSKALTIGQVAATSGVSTHTLRYYEQAGLLRSIGRTDAGHRLYAPADLDWLQFVMRLKATGCRLRACRLSPRCVPKATQHTARGARC
ncbi:hypothetical protein PPGU19_019030 [Paraburkholderia sp. PGU19]|nr:hypothetical protein PPGU19_019030 [Paraburkholderia sp. PGU19]